MPAAEYETRTDSVLAWKKAQKLGRFDPNAPSIEQQKILASEREIDERGKQYIPRPLYIFRLHVLLPIPIILFSYSKIFTLHSLVWAERNELVLGMKTIEGVPP